MFKKIRCRGVLLKEMHKNTYGMAVFSFFVATIPIIILSFSCPDGSIGHKIAGYILIWYLLSVAIANKSDYDNTINKIITLPLFVSIKFSAWIFRLFLKRKYPEMEEEHYNRWVKLQRLKTKINKR